MLVLSYIPSEASFSSSFWNNSSPCSLGDLKLPLPPASVPSAGTAGMTRILRVKAFSLSLASLASVDYVCDFERVSDRCRNTWMLTPCSPQSLPTCLHFRTGSLIQPNSLKSKNTLQNLNLTYTPGFYIYWILTCSVKTSVDVQNVARQFKRTWLVLWEDGCRNPSSSWSDVNSGRIFLCSQQRVIMTADSLQAIQISKPECRSAMRIEAGTDDRCLGLLLNVLHKCRE